MPSGAPTGYVFCQQCTVRRPQSLTASSGTTPLIGFYLAPGITDVRTKSLALTVEPQSPPSLVVTGVHTKYPPSAPMPKTCRAKGGGLFEFQTPFPPCPPKFSNACFSKLRFRGKVLAPKALNFFFWPLEGVFFFTLHVYLKILRIWWRMKKWVKNPQKNLTRNRPSGRTLADGSQS